MKYRNLMASASALAVTLSWAVAVGSGAYDFSVLYPTATVAGANPSCVMTGTVVTPPTAGSNCNIQPDEQTIAIHRLALCTSKPAPPTTGAAGLLSACQFIFTSASSTGSPVNIVLNSTAMLSNGTTAKPANDTYTHLYLEIDPVVKIKSLINFDTPMADSNGLTSGVYCWSKAATTYNFSLNSLNSMPQATQCGNSVPAFASIESSSSLFNSLMDDSGLGGSGFTNAFTNLPTTAGGASTLDAYLIGSDGQLVTTQTVNSIGAVNKIAAIMTLPGTGIVVSDSTRSFVLGYNNMKGGQVATQSGVSPSRVSKIGNGPFDMTVATQ